MSRRPRPATTRVPKPRQSAPDIGVVGAGTAVSAFDLSNRQADLLTGQILVAMPTLTDSNFAQTVILICAHSPDGAMGIIINRSLERPSFVGLLQQLEINPLPPQREIRLCAGGPVETVRGFVVHTTDWMADGSLRVDERLGLTTSLDVLRAVAQGEGPRECLLALGYAGWGPGQLEDEFGQNSWLSVPADEALVFTGKNETRWRRALQKLQVDPALLSPVAGHA
jgi:putative transcriptional regulator